MSEPQAKRQAMSSLEQLRELTVVVADTGDFEGILMQFVKTNFIL